MTILTNDILLRAAEKVGIDLAGIVDIWAFEDFGRKVKENDIEDLAFFDGKLSDRFDYLSVWSETKGIISFGMAYYSHVPHPADGKRRGIISTASYGEDYHTVLQRKAQELMDEITKECPMNYRIFVDTGNLSDRALAYCAGLGFYGKNNFLINEKYGSYIFLGHILVDEMLTRFVMPLENKCGGCEICHKACPNGCYGDKMIDYERCISYQTQKGNISDSKGYLYGCDLCQVSCPHNIGIPSGLHEEFSADAEFAYPELEGIISMEKEDFSRIYGKSALAWRRLGNLKKNAEAVLKKGE
ncbi:MAG: tRNA epoxyqueuosine(34) reductase QueG [Eubacteriaceae bacterium]|nr:tRNA epoxyqueuosine(34) reductase QueG [Eubacteriaceae bacterium]